MKGFLHGS
jgi:hypothetical protein